MPRNKYLVFLVFAVFPAVLISSVSAATKQKVDSLFSALSEENADSATIFNRIAKAYFISPYDSCEKYSNLALAIAQRHNDKENIALALTRLAFISNEKGFSDDALNYYFKALKFWDDLGKKQRAGYIYNNIGVIYLDISDYENSKKYLKLALKNINPEECGNIYNNIGLGFQDQNELDSALFYYQKALSFYSGNNNKIGIATSIANIGRIYREKGDYQQALKFLNQAYQLFSEADRKHGCVIVLLNMGTTYLQKKDYPKAEKYFREVIEKAEKGNFYDELKNAYYYYSQLLKAENKYKKAIEYFDKFHTLSDSIRDITKVKQVNELNIKYQTVKTNQEIQLLEQQKKFQVRKLKLQKIIIWGLAILVSLIVILLFIIVRLKQSQILSYRALIKKNVELIEKEDIIKQTKQYDKQQKEIDDLKQDLEKYSHSSLSEIQKNAIKTLIEKALEEDKVYLQKGLTLNKLSEMLNVSRTYISQVINEQYHKNFNTLINEYRIKEAQRLLITNKKYSIEGIAHEVGFNSKSTFNAAFKAYTGVTPSFFLKNYNKD